jgi:hypothetical protein
MLAALPLNIFSCILSALDDSPSALCALRETSRSLSYTLASTAGDSLTPAWLRVLSSLDPAGCLLHSFTSSPASQYLSLARRCSPPTWGGLCTALTRPGCVGCQSPTKYLHYSGRLPLARRCRGCRGRTAAQGASGTEVEHLSRALFGQRRPICTVTTEATLLAALARAVDGDTIAISASIQSTLGNGWGGGLFFGPQPAVRLLGVGSKAPGLRVLGNALYFGTAVLCERLTLTSGMPDTGSGSFHAGLWVAGPPFIAMHCAIVSHMGSAIVSGGGGSFPPPFHFALLSTQLESYTDNFAHLHPDSIGRFLGCSFGPHLLHTGGLYNAPCGTEEQLRVMQRRNSFAPGVRLLDHADPGRTLVLL